MQLFEHFLHLLKKDKNYEIPTQAKGWRQTEAPKRKVGAL